MKIALVHEFLNQLGGAERVLKNFLEIWPDATIHVLLYDNEKTSGIFEPYKKVISFLEKMPFIRTHHRLYLSLMPFGVESFRFDNYDVVISDSSSFAKGAKARGKLHICYCHTPTRFLWSEGEDYLSNQPYPSVIKMLARPVMPLLRGWDRKAARRPDYFIANSENVRQRIRKYYDRDSVVIPPPVDTELFHPEGKKENYYFVASRLEPYKKIELVIEAFNRLQLPLKVAGSGTSSGKLKKMAKANIEFLGRISDEELRRRYSEARAFIFPAEEDAGIMVLEAQSCGTPVIAFGKGGALETVVKGVTGEFFPEQNSDSLIAALNVFNPSKFDARVIRDHALQYDKRVFQNNIRSFVEDKFKQFSRNSES